jgi:aspartate/methionine/tyrosine aminotransferase
MQTIAPFELERYLAKHEFTAKYPFSSSDCDSLTIKELLDLCSTPIEKLALVWLGYTEPLGHPQLREAISSLYSKVKPDEILVHTGAEEAIYNFVMSYLKPEDHLVVHFPCYQSLYSVAEARGCEVTKWQADEKKGWALDLDFLKRSIKKNTRVVIVNAPHNPTGHLPTRQWFDELISILQKQGIFLFLDEVYRGIEYDKNDRLPAAADAYENALSLGVMSKSYGLAGLRIGWIATRNKEVYEKMMGFKDYTTICNSAPSEFLSTIAIQNHAKLWSNNLKLIQENISVLNQIFINHPDKIEWVKPKAGCIGFPRYKGKEGAQAFSERLLRETGVLLSPGKYFCYDDDHFRIGFGRHSFKKAAALFDSFL